MAARRVWTEKRRPPHETSGAPLGRAIGKIATEVKCEVLIAVVGKRGTLLIDGIAIRLAKGMAF
jgi:hypothetical protein